jgi:hypothetical protein
MLLILFLSTAYTGTEQLWKIKKEAFLKTGAPPGAVNSVLFIKNRQSWSEKKDTSVTYSCY